MLLLSILAPWEQVFHLYPSAARLTYISVIYIFWWLALSAILFYCPCWTETLLVKNQNAKDFHQWLPNVINFPIQISSNNYTEEQHVYLVHFGISYSLTAYFYSHESSNEPFLETGRSGHQGSVLLFSETFYSKVSQQFWKECAPHCLYLFWKHKWSKTYVRIRINKYFFLWNILAL